MRDAFAQEGLAHLDAEIQGIVAGKAALFDESLKDRLGEVQFLAAKDTEELIGMISFGPRGKEIRECTGEDSAGIGKLGTLYVLPEYQDQGVGSALIQALVRQLHQQGVEQFCLDSGFKRAKERWLRKFGQPYVVAPDYWGPGVDHMVWLCHIRDHLQEI